jgi:hypothetical protein
MVIRKRININGKEPLKTLYSCLVFCITGLAGLQNTYAQAEDRVTNDIEGTWILDTAIVIQTDDEGSDTSIYLFGDTSMIFDRPQPPQKIIITPKTVTFEYSTANPQIGKYSFDGRRLWICFRYLEEYICIRIDPEHLQLHYTVYLSAYFAGSPKQVKEDGFFKVRKYGLDRISTAM